MNFPQKPTHLNNFDFLRLFFASAVIISHSFPLTAREEIFAKWSSGQFDLGELSVNIFFAMSGYLIFQSLQRSKNMTDYVWKRILRLYPALIVMLVLTMLILPVIYSGKNIQGESSYKSYFLNGLSLYNMQFKIRGVFENNPYPQTINASLWTLSYEFTMYMTLLGLFIFRKKKICLYILLFAFSLMYWAAAFRPGFLSGIFDLIHIKTERLHRLGSYFLAGALLTYVNISRFNTLIFRCALAITLLFSVFFYKFKFVAPVVLPLLIISIGILQTKNISKTGLKLGDISYGMYIYGFLIQQILLYFFNLSTYLLMIISLVLTFIPAYISWHLIESKALQYKNLFKSRFTA